MPALTNEEVMLIKFKKTHGDKYDYSKVKYTGMDKKVNIICKQCNNEFLQKPTSHINGSGCPVCAINKQKLSNEELLTRFKKVHSDKYDYSKINYINKETPIEIVCSKHGSFLQKPRNHLDGSGCPQCAKENTWKLKKKRVQYTQESFIEECSSKFPNIDYSETTYTKMTNKIIFECSIHGLLEQRAETHIKSKFGCSKCAKEAMRNDPKEFIKKAKEIHGDKYDYSKINYINTGTNVEIVCPIHGSFFQTPGNHIKNKQGCRKCFNQEWSDKAKDSFAEKAESIHPDKYYYNEVDYIDYKTPVKIICKKHGEFYKTPNKILQGYGCLKCSPKSKGEEKIQEFLEENNIKYSREVRLFDKYRFDFYLEKLNLVIEFDGIQHFKPVEYFGGEEGFKETRERDKIKEDYLKEKDIKLLRISYEEFDKIKDVLSRSLGF